MEIGPFAATEKERIEELFQSKNVKFRAIVEIEELKSLRDRNFAYGRNFFIDLKVLWFEIADEDFSLIQKEIEKFGIVPLSDGVAELGSDDGNES